MKKLTKFPAAQLKRTGYVGTVWEDGLLSIGISYCVMSNSYSVTWYNGKEPTTSKHRISRLSEAYKVASL